LAAALLIATTFHESAHGYVAHFLGDGTGSRVDRVSLNLLLHCKMPAFAVAIGGKADMGWCTAYVRF
jgi:Zn-dependent protease